VLAEGKSRGVTLNRETYCTGTMAGNARTGPQSHKLDGGAFRLGGVHIKRLLVVYLRSDSANSDLRETPIRSALPNSRRDLRTRSLFSNVPSIDDARLADLPLASQFHFTRFMRLMAAVAKAASVCNPFAGHVSKL